MALSPLYYIAALALALVVVASDLAAARQHTELTRYQSPEEKTDTLVKDWAERLTFGLYGGARRKSGDVAGIARSARYHEGRARLAAWALLGLSTGFLALIAAASRREPGQRTLVLHLLGVAGVFLLVGLGAPVLTISARGEVAVIGEVVLQYETKGILSTIASLLDTGHLLIGGLVALFSVVVPVGKLALSLTMMWARGAALRRGALRLIELVGRWSMTDVLVVAVLLAFLAADTEQLTDATLGAGLYFFAGYGFLSLAAGHLMLRYERMLEGSSG